MVDTADLKSAGLCRTGSSPVAGICARSLIRIERQTTDLKVGSSSLPERDISIYFTA